MDYKSQNATPNKRQGLRNRFKMQQVLGEGTYGKVRLAIDRNTGIKVRQSETFSSLSDKREVLMTN